MPLAPPPPGPIVERRVSVPWLAAIKDTRARRIGFARRFYPTFHRVIAGFAPGQNLLWHLLTVKVLAYCGGVETGWGAGLFNWNFGFIQAFNRERRYPFHDSAPVYDSDGTYLRNDPYNTFYRAHVTELAGVLDQIVYFRARTPYAWQRLIQGSVLAPHLTVSGGGEVSGLELSDGGDSFIVALRKSHYFGGHGETDAHLDAVYSQHVAGVHAAVEDLDQRRPAVLVGAATALAGVAAGAGVVAWKAAR